MHHRSIAALPCPPVKAEPRSEAQARADRLESLRYELMLLDHKNVWSKQDRQRRLQLQDEIAALEAPAQAAAE